MLLTVLYIQITNNLALLIEQTH